MKILLVSYILLLTSQIRALHGDTIIFVCPKFCHELPIIERGKCRLIEEEYILLEESPDADYSKVEKALKLSKHCIFITSDYRIIMEFGYSSMEVQGHAIFYHYNGVPKERSQYFWGRRMGHCYFYNKRGRLKKHQYYGETYFQ